MRLISIAATIIVLLSVASPGTAATYNIDPAHSWIGFSVKHMVVSTVRGGFSEFAGVINYDPDNPANSSVEVNIKAASINTNNEKRDNHLRSADFLDVESYPEITFKSKKIKKSDEGFVAVGDLTIRGTSRQIELEFTVNGPALNPWGQTLIGVEVAKSKINRKDFGANWNKALEAGGFLVGDIVTIEMAVEAVIPYDS